MHCTFSSQDLLDDWTICSRNKLNNVLRCRGSVHRNLFGSDGGIQDCRWRGTLTHECFSTLHWKQCPSLFVVVVGQCLCCVVCVRACVRAHACSSQENVFPQASPEKQNRTVPSSYWSHTQADRYRDRDPHGERNCFTKLLCFPWPFSKFASSK